MRATNFVSRLRQSMEVRPRNFRARKRLDSYDRYTFYRLLGQLGVDSAPALRGKININHANDWPGTPNQLDGKRVHQPCGACVLRAV